LTLLWTVADHLRTLAPSY